MKISEFKKEMKKIEKCLNKAHDLFNNLPTGLQDEVYDIHNSENSLNHCLRWGLQAAEELSSKYAKEVITSYNQNYK